MKDGSGDELGKELARKHIEVGLGAINRLLQTRRTEKGQRVGPYGTGTFSPTIADACIVPQLYNARRFGINLEEIGLCKTNQARKSELFHINHQYK